MEVINNSLGSDKLHISLESKLNSIRKRGVSYNINALSGDCAIVNVTVNGKNGIGTQSIAVVRNESYDATNPLNYKWILHTNNSKVLTDNLSDITIYAKKIISKLKTLVNKFS